MVQWQFRVFWDSGLGGFRAERVEGSGSDTPGVCQVVQRQGCRSIMGSLLRKGLCNPRFHIFNTPHYSLRLLSRCLPRNEPPFP